MRQLCSRRPGINCVLVLLALFASLLQACGPQRSSTLDEACRNYRLGKYQVAMDQAMSSRYTGSSRDRLEAAYIAGLAAARLGDHDTARDMLGKAVVSPDRSVAGNANATLGTVLLAVGQPLQAARCFDRASELLTGDDVSRARMDAGHAYKDAGLLTEARKRFDAAGETSNVTQRRRSQQEIEVTGFAIQAGAFLEWDNAMEHAGKVSAEAIRVGMPQARIISVQRGDRRLHLVQLGSYPDRSWAAAERRKLEGAFQGLTVVPVAVAD